MIDMLMVIVGAVGALTIGIFVLSQDSRKLENRLYAMIAGAFVVLMSANYFTSGQSTDAVFVLTCIRIVLASTVVILALLYYLIRALLPRGRERRYGKIFSSLVGVVGVGVSALVLTPLVFESVTLGADGFVLSVDFRFGVMLFGLYSLLVLAFCLGHLFSVMRHGGSQRRAQALVILIGVLPTFLFAPLTSFILPVLFHHVEFIALTPVYVMLFVASVAYAIVRHRLFDIRFAAVRTAAYILTLAVLAVVYYLLAYVISVFAFSRQGVETQFSVNTVNIALALVIAFVFQPIKNFFDKVTRHLFYKDSYAIGEFVAALNHVLNSTNEIHSLLERTAYVIGDTLKAEQVVFMIETGEGRPLVAGTRDSRRVAGKDVKGHGYAFGAGEVIIASQLEANNSLRRMMVSHNFELMMSLGSGDESLGYVFLGEHKAGSYTEHDILALHTVSEELIIAIRNAFAVEEVRRLNATLEQRIDNATKELRRSNAQLQKLDEAKDEFISMASHQLRTPLTSIKGYVSMMMDGDVGKLSDEQRHVLQEVFISSERMVRLIGDFLNVSRLQTGKFVIEKRPIDLALLVQREVDALASNASARGITFSYVRPKNIPLLELDENKMQQVVMNFADNAIYYSKPDSKVTVKLRKVKGWVELTVKDTGIGVPAGEQGQLFTKFFRAANARKQRPDGTGVGLYLAKRVVTDHQGEIIFESKEGKGSTFGFRLPLKK